MDSRKVIELPDGFNGATLPFYADPVETDGHLVKLQCAAMGKEYMHRWARADDHHADCLCNACTAGIGDSPN